MFWELRKAITGLTLGGYIESIPLIGGVISHQARNYVATGNRTSIDPFGFGDMAAVYDFLKLCNDIMSHDEEKRHWDAKATLKLANAIRGLGIAAGSILPNNQAGATIKASLNALNTAGNITRDYLIHRTNDQRRRPPRHPIVSYGFPNAVDLLDDVML
ncbi:MAG: hypothetical protein Q4F30_02350 [Akkermansia sp.]|nr:hypothetical protein [Akkermansia sp.]